MRRASRQLVVALADPVQAERKPDALFRGLEMMKVAVLAVRSWPSSLSSITTSATQPLGRQRTKPARPTSTLSSFRPRPEGSSTPERRHHPHQLALLVGGLQHDHGQAGIGAVLSHHALDQGALLGLGAGRGVAADLPVAMDRPHRALGAGGRGQAEKQRWRKRRQPRAATTAAAVCGVSARQGGRPLRWMFSKAPSGSIPWYSLAMSVRTLD